jgi:hypothetical protein
MSPKENKHAIVRPPRDLDAVCQYVRDQLRHPNVDFGPLGRAAKGTAK